MYIKKFLMIILYGLCSKIANKKKGLTILTYHRISEYSDLSDPLKISASVFAKQLSYLKNSYRLLSGDELAYIIRKRESYPENSLLITFDDGWRDNYIYAYPILKKYQIPAVIFLSTDYIGTDRSFWHERLKCVIAKMVIDKRFNEYEEYLKYCSPVVNARLKAILNSVSGQRYRLIQDLIVELKSYPLDYVNEYVNNLAQSIDYSQQASRSMLSWEEVKEMARENIMFGSHTKTHALLTHIEESLVAVELSDSKNIIEMNVGKPVYYFSYPNGYYNDRIANMVRDASYLAAFTCNTGINQSHISSYELQRQHIAEYYSTGINGKYSELFFKIELANIRKRVQLWRKNEAY